MKNKKDLHFFPFLCTVMRARGRAIHYCLENYLLMLTTEAYLLMKVSWSLLLLTLVTTSPILAADDEIWGPATEEQGEQSGSMKSSDAQETEESPVDRMPSPVEDVTGDAKGEEGDEAD